MKGIFAIIMFVIFIITMTFSNFSRFRSSKNVNKLIDEAKKLSGENQNKKAIEVFKNALSLVLGINDNKKWSLYELKDNINKNGWYIINELDRLYKLENINFDLSVWSNIVGQLSMVERQSQSKLLSTFIINAFHALPNTETA